MEQQKKKMSMGKKILIGVGVLIVLAIIGSQADKSDKTKQSSTASSSSSTETKQEKAAKKYVEVYTFKGNGMKKSPVFELTGGNAKLHYKYTSEMSGMGMFSVYVTPEGEDVMKTGGIPEVMSQAENEETESSIQKSAGKYYLHVNASGKWEITVLEEK